MGRIILLVILVAAGWYCYKTGIYYAVTHGFVPEPDKVSEVVGPVGTGFYMASSPENIRYVLDTHIGTPEQKSESNLNLQQIISRGDVVHLDDHTKVRAIESDKLKVYGCEYPVVHVEVVGGESNGAKGWIERDNLIDNPLQQLSRSWGGPSITTNGTGNR